MAPVHNAGQLRLSLLSPPFVVGAVMLVLTIGLWWVLEEQEHLTIHDRAKRDTTNFVQSIENRLARQRGTVDGLSEKWMRSNGMPQNEWNFETALFLRTNPGQLYFNFIDQNFIVQRQVNADGVHELTSSEADTGTYPRYRTYLETVASGPEPRGVYFFSQPDGRHIISVHTALTMEGSFAGIIGGGADLSALIDRSVSNFGRVVEVQVSVNGVNVFETPGFPRESGAHFETKRQFTFGNLTFDVETFPSARVQGEMTSSLPLIVLGVGLLLTAAVSRLVYREDYVKHASSLLLRQNQALDQSQDAVTVTDRNGRIIQANAGAVKLFGYSKSELIGMQARTLMADDYDFNTLNSERLKAHQTKGVWNCTVRVKTKTGEERAVATSETLVYDANGKLECAVGTGRDVTEEEYHKNRLVESERQFRSLYESSQDGIIIRSLSIEGRWEITSVNSAFSRITGYSVDDLRQQGTSNANLHTKQDQEKLKDALTQLKVEGHSDPVEIGYRCKDGTVAYFSTIFWHRLDQQGRPLQTFTVMRDVTAQRQARERLEEAQRIARLGSWEHDCRTGATTWSPELYALLDRDPADGPFSWDEFGKIMDPLDDETFAQARDDSLGASQSTVREYRVKMRDGSRRFLRETTHLIHGPDGEEIRRVGTTQDITEVRQLEAELRHIQKLRTVGQLTGGVAHDFNNILGVISSNAQFLEMVSDDPEEVHVVADRIVSAVHKGAKLTDQLLSFSRKQALNTQEIDTAAFLKEISDTLSRTLGDATAVNVEMDPSPWNLVADEHQLSNALINLALNGRDAMDHGGALTVSARNIDIDADHKPADLSVEPGPYIALSVADEGEGMSQEVLDQALEPFFTTKEVGKGTGLGLSMVYGFAEQSRGGLTLESEPGEGTVVTLYLPASKGAALQQPKNQLLQNADVVNLHTILLIEDQPDLQNINEQIFRRMGHRVVVAEDAASALDMAEKSLGIDVAFVDIILPGGTNGIEVARALREINPKVRILFTSGYASTEVLKQLDKIPHDGLFKKPINVKEVTERLNSIFSEQDQLGTQTSVA